MLFTLFSFCSSCLTFFEGITIYREKWLLESENRLHPHNDSELSIERTSILGYFLMGMNAGKSLMNTPIFLLGASGSFDDAYVTMDMYYIEPKRWWACYG